MKPRFFLVALFFLSLLFPRVSKTSNLQQITAPDTVITIEGTGHPPAQGDTDPGCYDEKTNPHGGNCKSLCTFIPKGSKSIETFVYVAEVDEKDNWFGPCPKALGTLNCGGIPRSGRGNQKDFGWIRVFPDNFIRSPAGINWESICYNVNNWANRARYVKLVVKYVM